VRSRVEREGRLPDYVKEYRDELQSVGPDEFVRRYPYPVLIVAGLAGTLKNPAKTGTVVAESSELLLVGTIIGRVFSLVKARDSAPGPLFIGRTSDNDVGIPEYSISKKHCYLTFVGMEIHVTDCGSTNGTLVEGIPLEPRKPRVLKGGETLTLGRFALVLCRPHGFVSYLESNR